MEMFNCVYILAVCYGFLSGAYCMKDVIEDIDDSKERRDDIIQEVVRSLLGVKEVETEPSPRRTPPRYMLDLYDRYKSGQTPGQGNTVRSILPMRGKLKGVDMLVFNLTGIDADEQILQGKFHIFRRKQSRRGGGGGSGGRKREAIRLKVTDLSLKFPPHWVDVPKQKNSGWQSFDVTESVIQCRNAQHDGDHLLGISSESRRPNGKYKPMPIRRIARLSTQPFLIIFSEDRNNRTVNNTAEQETVSPSYEEIRQMLLRHRQNTSENHRLPEGQTLPRQKRSVRADSFLNYLPRTDDIQEENTEHESRQNGSVEEIRRAEAKDSRRKTNNSSICTLPRDSEPQELRQKPQKIRKASRRRKQKEKYDIRPSAERRCQRKDLIVDFSLLGWSDFIVHPLSFNAYYCAGACFNPSNRINISNHALIQSILHSHKDFRVNSEKVPAPCCVPSSTKSLDVFYINKAGVTQLRNFPDMIVESCACR